MMLVPLFFVSIFIVTMVFGFFIGTQGMFVQRTFLNIPLSLFEKCVERIDPTKVDGENELLTYNEAQVIQGEPEEGEDIEDRVFKFNIERLNVYLTTYLSSNLKNKVTTYQYVIYSYIYENDEFTLVESNEDPNAVKVRFKCKYYKDYGVDQTLSFYIKETWSTNYE